jgi:hypothetical protein
MTYATEYDMGFGTWNIGSLYRVCSLVSVSKELSKYKLDLVGVQVTWEGSGIEPAGEYSFSTEREMRILK